MSFRTLDTALEMIRSVRGPLEKLATRDTVLSDQVRRAAASVPANLAEGARRTGKDQSQHYKIAAGSAAEVMAEMQIAEAWGKLDADEIAPVVRICDQILAMIWKLTHR